MGFLTTGEAARMCGVGLNTIKRWIRQDRIPHIQTPGGHWRIPRKDFLHFMAMLQPKEIGAAPGSEPSSEQKPRILIIDDDPQVCEILSDAIAANVPFPCETACAHDGYTGLIQIGRMRPALLVLDIMMPEINGLELLHRLRQRPELCDGMKILIFTGARDRRLVMRKVAECAPDAILLKPAGVDEFLRVAMPLLQPSAGRSVPGVRVG